MPRLLCSGLPVQGYPEYFIIHVALQHSLAIEAMVLVVIGWLYVALMMAIVEASSTNGTLLGAIITFLLYGVGPVALVVYLMATPARRKAIRARQQAEAAMAASARPAARAPAGSGEPDAGGEAPGAAVAPVRKEP